MSFRCQVCGERFSGTAPELREALGPHAKTHPDVEEVAFEGEPFVLSCNCGECEFCAETVTA